MSLEAPDPQGVNGSLDVHSFGRPKVLEAVRQAVRLLPSRKRRLLVATAVLQVSLGILDLIGIALVGLVAAVAVSGIDPSSLPGWASNALALLGLSGLTVSQLSVTIALAAVTVLVLKTVLSAFLSRRITFFLANCQADLSSTMAARFLRQPLTDVQHWTTAEATYALNAGAGAATVALLGSTVMIASETFLFVIIGLSLLVFDPALTLVAAVFFGSIVIGLQRFLGRIAARNAGILAQRSMDIQTTVSEALATYREVTVLNRRDLYVRHYQGIVGTNARAGAANSYILEVPKYVLEAALYLGVLVLGVVQFLTKDWSTAASTVAIFLAAGTRVTPAMLRLQGATITARNAAVQAQPTFYMAAYLQRGEERERSQGAATPATSITAERIQQEALEGFPGFRASIEVQGVSLTYRDAEEPALHDVSFTAQEGSSVALVGATGAGKSTLADVLLGVHKPDRGSVLISGLGPREAIDRWPGAITYVPQAVALVAGSVRDNVALGLPRELVDDDMVWSALRRAHLAEYLDEYRDGLDTPVGERGFRLSGGQRQRLGIARALYTRPRLLVLDEATSALDSDTERSIIQTLDELEGEVTTVTVAHRLATIRRADQVIYLHQGRVAAKGTFAEVRELVPDFDRQASLLGL